MPLNPPGFSPPVWPRLGAFRGDTGPALGLPPPPIEIPLCWLSQPVTFRLEKPYTTATVTRTGHGTTRAVNRAALADTGDQTFEATLDSACSADAGVLAHFTTSYRAEPLNRCPELILDLMHRTDEERIRILSIQRGQRIRIVGVPDEFPEGAASLIVSGISDDIGVMSRRVRLTTRAVIGVEPGIPGPWWRAGSSPALGSNHIIPF